MLTRKLLLLSCLFFSLNYVQAQLPHVYIMPAARLADLKKLAAAKDKGTLQLLDSLRTLADAFLKMKPVSVMEKAFTPVSGNKHDYMSQAPYFWYDSTKQNGLPYIRRDGQHNPEIKKITDRTYIGDLENATKALALAWYLTGEERYAAKAAVLLRTWFFDEATKMNPHLDYAQAIPGINNGRGIGIIESRTLTGIADAAGLLEGSNSWKAKDIAQLKDWYVRYLQWMLTSKNGNDEHAAKNNHGTWFYVQVVDFALFTGQPELARKLVEESKRRMDSQITKEGRQPLELERTNALGYSTFNLRAWFELATLAEKTGVDLWQYTNTNGAGLRTALEWLYPYALGQKKWTYQQIGNYNVSDIYPLMWQASKKFNNAGYLKALDLSKTEVVSPMAALLYKAD